MLLFLEAPPIPRNLPSFKTLSVIIFGTICMGTFLSLLVWLRLWGRPGDLSEVLGDEYVPLTLSQTWLSQLFIGCCYIQTQGKLGWVQDKSEGDTHTWRRNIVWDLEADWCSWKTLWDCYHFQETFKRIALDNVCQPFSCVPLFKASYYSNPSNVFFRTHYQRNFPGQSPNGWSSSDSPLSFLSFYFWLRTLPPCLD